MKILKKKTLQFILPLLVVAGVIACKKLENGALSNPSAGPTTQLNIRVINLKNNQPEPGVKFFISRRINTKGEYQVVDTARTNDNGEYQLETPVPNDFKAYLDTTFYTGDTASVLMTALSPATIELKTHPKFGMAPVEVSVIDSASLQPIENFDLMVSYRNSGKPGFVEAGRETTDASGKILMSLPWPSVVKAKIADDNFKPDSILIDHLAGNGSSGVLKVSTLAAVHLNLYDTADLQYISGANVKFSIKPQGEANFSLLPTLNTDEDGNVQLFAKFPAVLKVEVQNLKFFRDTVFDITLSNFATINKLVGLSTKAPAYSEPVLTNLQVSTLTLNNGITLSGPQDVTTDHKGNIYITDAGNNRIIKVDANGNASVLAGGSTIGKTDGAATTATFAAPYGIKVANNGTIYVANNSSSGNYHAIRKITLAPNGAATVNTIAGSGASGGANGIGTAATFNRAAGLAIDKANKYLYIAEWSGHRVRRMDLTTNEVTTVAGSGYSGVVAGVGTTAQFQFPWGVALDDNDQYLYVASWNGTALHKIDLSNDNVTLIRKGSTIGFNQPRGVYVTSAGKIMVANTTGHYVSMVNNLNELGTSSFTVLAGSSSGNVDGVALSAKFNGPIGLWYDKYTGNWYVADGTNNQIRIIRSSDI